MNVLVINAGSSSLKYQLFDMDSKEVLAKGLCERIGIDGRLTHTNPKKEDKYKADVPMKDHADACLLYTSPSPRDRQKSRMPSSA